MKITHLTSAHPRHDIRIFVKECASLAAAGHEVTLIVADGQGEEINRGVRFHDVGPKTGGRLARDDRHRQARVSGGAEAAPGRGPLPRPELIPPRCA